MPNLSTLAGRLLTQELGSEDSTQLFTDARRQAAIFDGIREFADLTECNVRNVNTGVLAEFDLNNPSNLPVGVPDFVRFSADQPVIITYKDASSRITYLAGADLPERTPRWLDMHRPGWRNSTISTATGMQLPECFYRRTDGGQQLIGFYPTPSTGPGAEVRAILPYVAYPVVSTNSTWIPFTLDGNIRYDLQPFHQAFVHYAAHQLEKLRKDTEASDRQLQKFMFYVQRYLQSLRKKGGSFVSMGANYFRRGPSFTAEDPRT